jgi:hypothetical protein
METWKTKKLAKPGTAFSAAPASEVLALSLLRAPVSGSSPRAWLGRELAAYDKRKC